MGMRCFAAVLVALLLLPATAFADRTTDLVRDCQDDKIDGTYSLSDYQKALRAIGTDADEYSNCRELIRAAQLRAAPAATSRSTGSGGGTAQAGAAAAGAAGSGGSGGGGSAGTGSSAGDAGVQGSSGGAPTTVAPGGSSASAGGDAAPASPAAPAAAAATSAPDAAVGAVAAVPGASLTPADAGAAAASVGSGDDVPTTLALVLLGVGALLTGLGVLRRRAQTLGPSAA